MAKFKTVYKCKSKFHISSIHLLRNEFESKRKKEKNIDLCAEDHFDRNIALVANQYCENTEKSLINIGEILSFRLGIFILPS